MLSLRPIANFADHQKEFQNFDPQKDLWIVSDLRNKLQLQDQLLKNRRVLRDEAIYRISDFWKLCHKFYLPDYKIISRTWMRHLVQESLKNHSEEWLQRPGIISQVLSSIESLLPVLLHPQEEIFLEWFDGQSEAQKKWGHWYLICKQLLQEILQSRQILQEWIPALLLEKDLKAFDKIMDCKIFVDMNFDLSAIEIEILQRLAKFSDMHLLAPKIYPEKYQWDYKKYEFVNATNSKSDLTGQLQDSVLWDLPKNYKVNTFNSILSEVNAVTVQVRALVEEGVRPDQIFILAPEIAIYEDILNFFFEQEGLGSILTPKKKVATEPKVIHWLSHLQTRSATWNESDLEAEFFIEPQKMRMTASDFHRKFAIFYSQEDIAREPTLAIEMQQRRLKISSCSGHDFAAWITQEWKNKNTESLEAILYCFFRELDRDAICSLEEWLRLLKEVVQKMETTIERKTRASYRISDIVSSSYTENSHIFVLGLNEKDMRYKDFSILSPRDLQRLAQDLGLFLENAKANLDFHLDKLFFEDSNQFYFSYSESDRKGGLLGPSILILQALQDQNPKNDFLSSVYWQKQMHWSVTSEAFQRETNLAVFQPFQKVNLSSLSASRLEDYITCPFIFAAKSVFYMQDRPNLDVDIDPMSGGSFLHSLLAKIFTQDLKSWNSQSLSTLLEEMRSEVLLGEEKRWPSLKQKYLQMLERFIVFEIEWRKQYPATQTLPEEISFEGTLSGMDIPIRGSIDRIDFNEKGEAIVLDYKSSASADFVNASSWLKNNRFQLAIYSLAVQEGLTPSQATRVVGASYYILKTLQREKGFYVEEASDDFCPKQKALIAEEKMQEILQQLKEKMIQIIAKIRAGEFQPLPRKYQNL